MEGEVRIYGKDTGCLVPEAIALVNSGEEIMVFHLINMLGGIKWRTNHDAADGRFQMTPKTVESLTEIQYGQEYAVLGTRRFGVEIPEPGKGEHVAATDSYRKWFAWWKAYTNQMSEEVFAEFDKAVNDKEDLYKYRPEGSWK